jgi:hypothetical protein
MRRDPSFCCENQQCQALAAGEPAVKAHTTRNRAYSPSKAPSHADPRGAFMQKKPEEFGEVCVREHSATFYCLPSLRDG